MHSQSDLLIIALGTSFLFSVLPMHRKTWQEILPQTSPKLEIHSVLSLWQATIFWPHQSTEYILPPSDSLMEFLLLSEDSSYLKSIVQLLIVLQSQKTLMVVASGNPIPFWSFLAP